MKTRDLVIETLKKVGCQPEVDDKDNICFKYQGESLYVSADNNFKFITMMSNNINRLLTYRTSYS